MLEENECLICYSFLENSLFAGIAGCNHKFCKSCLFIWCLINKSCPLDRQNIEEVLYSEKDSEKVPIIDFLYNELIATKDSTINDQLDNILSILLRFQNTIQKFTHIFLKIDKFFQVNDRKTFQRIIDSTTLENLDSNSKLFELLESFPIEFTNVFSNENNNFIIDIKALGLMLLQSKEIQNQYEALIRSSTNLNTKHSLQDKCSILQSLEAIFLIFNRCYATFREIRFNMMSNRGFMTAFHISHEKSPSFRKIKLRKLFEIAKQIQNLFKPINSKLNLIKSLILLIATNHNKVKFIDQLESSANRCIICTESAAERIYKLKYYDKSICQSCKKIIHFRTENEENSEITSKIQINKNKENYHLLISEAVNVIYQTVKTTSILFDNIFQTQSHFFNLSNPTFLAEYNRNVILWIAVGVQRYNLQAIQNYFDERYYDSKQTNWYDEILDVCITFLGDFNSYLKDMTIFELNKITNEINNKSQLNDLKMEVCQKATDLKKLIERLLKDISDLVWISKRRKIDRMIIHMFIELGKFVSNLYYKPNISIDDIVLRFI